MEINGLQILFQVINFGVIFAVLVKFLYKPILKVLDDRRAKVEEGQHAAESSIREKGEIENLKKKARSQSEKEASKFLEEARDEAKLLKVKLSKEVKEEMKQVRENEMEKWQSELAGMKAELEKQVGKTAIAVAEKILGEELKDKKTQAKLVADAVKDLEKALA